MMVMSVNRYKIKIPTQSGTTGINLDIPISQIMGLAGQEDIINTKFVDVEVENSINEIFDYEKIKLLPKNSNNTITKGIMYKLNFLDGNGVYLPNTNWANLGMLYEDFKFRKNGFVKSFVRLDFFDTDVNSTQRLIFFITIYPKFALNDLNQITGGVPQPNAFLVDFKLGNTLLDRSLEGEGFALYHFKDEIIPTVPKRLYMRASFNNAKTGKTTKFMSSNDPNLSVDTLIRPTDGTNLTNNLHTKYLLKRETEGYYYTIDLDYSNNVTNLSGDYVINLYEISSI